MKKWNLARLRKLLHSSGSQQQRNHDEKRKSAPARGDDFIPHQGCSSEILERIATFLPIEDFRNFRLVNATIYNSTTHLFTRKHFEFQTVDFTFDGLKRLIEVSKH
ncbi:hypothetical protein FKW77_007080 [Venturia effusa]|uniref:F-box domain-containing protein n=1 Tax=Venturia effusa TaxID=50376 RepID=A0A517LE14_9PEZI|nr:hypothetical protein FKW77_007080 [Venturia effusa]